VFDLQEGEVGPRDTRKEFLISDIPRKGWELFATKETEEFGSYLLAHCPLLSGLWICLSLSLPWGVVMAWTRKLSHFYKIKKSKPAPELGVAGCSMLQLKAILGIVEILVIAACLGGKNWWDNASVTEL
jgi:hypothetical protein